MRPRPFRESIERAWLAHVEWLHPDGTMAQRFMAAELPSIVGAEREAAADNPPPLPDTLALLLAPGSSVAEWDSFVEEFSLLILHGTRSVSRTHDEAMDGYAHVLEEIQKEDYRRLRGYARDPQSKFTTWLVIVARRICVDLHRARYGRKPPVSSPADDGVRRVRRDLEDLVSAEVDLTKIRDSAGADADDELAAAEVRATLDGLLQTLPPEDRLILRLRFDDGLSASDVARAVGLGSQFQVYRRIGALMTQLRTALRARGVDGPTG